MIDWPVGLGIVVVVGLAIWWEQRNPGPTPGDADEARERELRVRLKQAAAAKKMKALGIKSLLEGRAAWQRINPMHVPDAPSKVVSMKRRKT